MEMAVALEEWMATVGEFQQIGPRGHLAGGQVRGPYLADSVPGDGSLTPVCLIRHDHFADAPLDPRIVADRLFRRPVVARTSAAGNAARSGAVRRGHWGFGGRQPQSVLRSSDPGPDGADRAVEHRGSVRIREPL